MNRIVEVCLRLKAEHGYESWEVAVRKEFAPEYGGGSQIFREDGSPSIHRALDVAREMVTMSPARRTA